MRLLLGSRFLGRAISANRESELQLAARRASSLRSDRLRLAGCASLMLHVGTYQSRSTTRTLPLLLIGS